MANKNKNVKELVSTDDDPTAELEAPTFKHRYGTDDEIEADANTFDASSGAAASNDRDSSVSGIDSDLYSQTKTIGRLQFDIEQLHAKWLGLEAEIKARESQTIQLNEQLSEQAIILDQKENLLQEHAQEIGSLETSIKQKDEEQQTLRQELEDVRQSMQTAEDKSDEAINLLSAEHSALTDQLNEQLTEQANTIDRTESLAKKYERKIESLDSAISQKNEEYQTLRRELDDVRQSEQQAKDDSDKAARELSAQHAALSNQLNKQLTDQAKTIDLKDKLLEENSQNIESLDSAISQKNEDYQTLCLELDDVRLSMQQATDDSDKAARELSAQHAALTDQLNKQLTGQAKTIEHKDGLLDENRQKIGSLEAVITQRDEEHQTLLQELDNVRQSTRKAKDDSEKAVRQLSAEHAALSERLIVAERVEAKLRHKLDRSDEYGDTIRRKLQDRITASDHLVNERDRFAEFLSSATQEKEGLAEELRETKTQNQKLDARLDSIKRDHNDEIGILRFELVETQTAVTEFEVVNAQLATELAAARSSSENLEQSLVDAEKHAKTRFESLQEEVLELRSAADDYDANIKTKSEAITSLLAELAKKSAQLESIGNIENVIQDIDDRMSERFAIQTDGIGDDDAGQDNKQTIVNTERVTRVMVGTIDNQVLRFPIFKDRMTVGRTEDNDIQLRASYVSRRHAVVQSEGGVTRIIDWDSKNGIYVNSERVSEHILSRGDIVTIGNARFRYEELKKRDL